MASIQEPGMVRAYRETPDGNRTVIFQERIENLAPAGGAPDAAGASVSTPEKRMTVHSPVELVNDDKLVITFTPDTGGDGIDASDCIWAVPLQTQMGTKTLGNSQFAELALADLTLIANEQDIAKYKVTEGKVIVSGKIYLDIQDDT